MYKAFKELAPLKMKTGLKQTKMAMSYLFIYKEVSCLNTGSCIYTMLKYDKYTLNKKIIS